MLHSHTPPSHCTLTLHPHTASSHCILTYNHAAIRHFLPKLVGDSAPVLPGRLRPGKLKVKLWHSPVLQRVTVLEPLISHRLGTSCVTVDSQGSAHSDMFFRGVVNYHWKGYRRGREGKGRGGEETDINPFSKLVATVCTRCKLRVRVMSTTFR